MGGRFTISGLQSFIFSLVSLSLVLGMWAQGIAGGAVGRTPPVIYVDADHRCPGEGTDKAPYCRIQEAFHRVQCGQRIHIRQAKRPYDETAVARSPSCAAHNPVVVEPAPGHTPILRYEGKGSADAVIELRDVDFWTVRGLTFDGQGIETSDSAIEVEAKTRSIRGVELRHNTIRNWGLVPLSNRGVRAIYIHGNRQTGFTAHDTVVQGNTLQNIRTNAMRIEGTQRAVIEHNVLSQLKCGWQSKDSFKHEAIKITTGQTRSKSPSNETLIRHNHIYDFQTVQACLAEYGATAGRPSFRGIYCDVNADDGRVIGNRIHNMSPAVTDANLTRGIYIESRCDNWEVRENLVYDVAGACFRISASGISVKLTHNTCYNAGLGIDYRGHDKVTITDNIIYLIRPKARMMRLDQAALKATYVVDRNLYFHPHDRLRFEYDDKRSALVGWRRRCQCDVASQSLDPQFRDLRSAVKDFRLKPESPARGMGAPGTTWGAVPQTP